MAHIFRLLPWPSISLATENNKCRKKNNNSHVRLSNTTGGELCRVLTAQNRHTEDWRISTHTHTQQEMDETQLDRGQRFVQADTFLFFFISNQLNCFGRGHSISFFSVGRFFDYEPTHTQWRKVMERKGKKERSTHRTRLSIKMREMWYVGLSSICVCIFYYLILLAVLKMHFFFSFYHLHPSIHLSLFVCACVSFIDNDLWRACMPLSIETAVPTQPTHQHTKSKRIFLWPLRANRQHEKTITISKKPPKKW